MLQVVYHTHRVLKYSTGYITSAHVWVFLLQFTHSNRWPPWQITRYCSKMSARNNHRYIISTGTFKIQIDCFHILISKKFKSCSCNIAIDCFSNEDDNMLFQRFISSYMYLPVMVGTNIVWRKFSIYFSKMIMHTVKFITYNGYK